MQKRKHDWLSPKPGYRFLDYATLGYSPSSAPDIQEISALNVFPLPAKCILDLTIKASKLFELA